MHKADGVEYGVFVDDGLHVPVGRFVGRLAEQLLAAELPVAELPVVALPVVELLAAEQLAVRLADVPFLVG